MATLQTLGTVRLRLRLGGDDYQETLHAVQGDTGRVIEFDVLDSSGTVVTNLAGVTPTLFVRRPDGKEVGSATGEIVGGVIRITIPSSLLAYAGETKAQIQLVDSANQHKLHDHLYRLQIEESLEAGASPGENLWFSLAELTEAIEEVHLLVEQYDTDVAAVATIRDDVTTKHSEVTTMHTSLQGVFDTEQARRTAESARVSAETNRQTAETARANAESARGTAEGTRKTQETARQQTETTRTTAETARVDAEKARASAEGTRVSQETTRQTQEGTRQTNETARVTQYQQAQQLLDILGEDPTVNLTNAVADLQTTAHRSRFYFDTPIPGALFKTDLSYRAMVYGIIEFNPYHNQTFYRKTKRYELRCYLYNPDNPSFIATSLISLSGSPPIEIRIGVTDNKFWVWIPQDIQFETVHISLETNLTGFAGNRITQVIGSEKPEVGEVIQDLIASPAIPNATQTYDGLYTKEHFSKVNAIPASPKYTDTITTINGKTGAIAKSDITALGIPAQDTVYTHPSTHPASMITQDSARRMVSDTQIASWNGKAAGAHTHDSVQTTQNTALKFSRLTQAQYDALATKDSATLYLIVG